MCVCVGRCVGRIVTPPWSPPQKSKIIALKKDKKGKVKHMFAEFVLAPIWSVRACPVHDADDRHGGDCCVLR